MKLKIIYGKSGSGKSTYLFRYIKDIIKNPSKIYIVTPEQFSFTAERNLLEEVRGAAINAEVLTFSRMAYRVMKDIGGNLNTIAPFGKLVLIYNILDKMKGNLKFLGKNMQNMEVIDKTLTEFKKHNISLDKLKNAIDNTEDKYLLAKLEDMYEIYGAYENSINAKFLDEEDILTILADNLKNTDIFKDTVICIDEFAGFTPQEYRVIEELMKITKEVNVTICTDEISASDKISMDADIFYNNKITAKKLMDIASRNNIEIDKPVFLDKAYRFKNKELTFLEENIYSNNYAKYDGEIENIKLFLAANPYSEIEHVASTIIEEVSQNKYRYKDIGVITKNIDTYSALIKAIFAKYDIPVYIDEKKDLSQNILIKYILSMLDVFAKNWSYDSVISYAKSGLIGIEEEDIYLLENFAKKWGIRYSKWYKGDWNFGEEDLDKLKHINEIRRKLITPLIEFKDKFVQSLSAKDIASGIYEFLIKNEIDKRMQDKAKLQENENPDLASEYEASFNIAIDILDEIVKIFGDEKLTFDKFASFLKISFTENGLGKLPAGIDQVTVGDVDRSRSHKVKVIFIIGVNDRKFPKCK